MKTENFYDFLIDRGYCDNLEQIKSIEELEQLSLDYYDIVYNFDLGLNEHIAVENNLAGWKQFEAFDYEKHNELFEREAKEEWGYVPKELPDVFNENEDADFSTRWMAYNKIINHSKYYSNFEEFTEYDRATIIEDTMHNNFHGSPTLKEANDSVIKVIDEYTKFQRN
jgi:hypothetical protein